MAWVPLKNKWLKVMKNIYRKLGSWAWGCGSWLQVVEAAANLVPEQLSEVADVVAVGRWFQSLMV